MCATRFLQPETLRVAGFDPLMPSFKSEVDDGQIMADVGAEPEAIHDAHSPRSFERAAPRREGEESIVSRPGAGLSDWLLTTTMRIAILYMLTLTGSSLVRRRR